MMMKNNKDNAIILLSGGLDSLVTTAYAKNKFNINKFYVESFTKYARSA